MQHFRQGMKHLRAITYCLAQTARTNRQDHELLQVNTVICMHPAVNDIHHRYRHLEAVTIPQYLIQANVLITCDRLGIGQRNRQQRIGAQPSLVLGAIQFDHQAIKFSLRRCILTQHGITNHGVDVSNRLADTLATKTFAVTVAQLNRLA